MFDHPYSDILSDFRFLIDSGELVDLVCILATTAAEDVGNF